MESPRLRTNELQSFLLLSSSIVYLKLIGSIDTFDGKQWEEFIQLNLPHFDQFELSILCHQMIKVNVEHLQSIIELFRSRFWIEHKKCFIQCRWDHRNRCD